MPTEAELEQKYQAFKEANKQMCKCGAEMMKENRHTWSCLECCRLLKAFSDGSKFWYKLEHMEGIK